MQRATMDRSSTELRIANAPPEIVAAINRRRREIGLPQVEARRPPAGRPAAPAKTFLTVFIVAAPGRCSNPAERNRPEEVSWRAWDLAAINAPTATWDLRRNHGGASIDHPIFHRLRAEALPRGGLVITWRPDMNRPSHAVIVREIERGHRAVSVGLVRQRSRSGFDFTGRTIDIVEKARLDHVAILSAGSRAAYPAASAWVARVADFELARLTARDRAIEAALALL